METSNSETRRAPPVVHCARCANNDEYNCDDFRRLGGRSTEAGRAHARDAYHTALRERIQAVESGDTGDWRILLKRLAVPADAIHALEKPQDSDCVREARKWMGAPRELLPFLVFVGPNGVAKSVAGAWVLRKVAENFKWCAAATGQEERPGLWIQARRFTTLSGFGDADRELYNLAQRVPWLVVDDAGDEANDWGRCRLIDLWLTRLDQNRRTVITSNLKPESFWARYDNPPRELGDAQERGALRDRLRQKAIAPNLANLRSMRERKA